jgi:hypothetical protein
MSRNKKQPTKEERAHMGRVVQIGCLICLSPPEIHHTGTYQGGGRDHKRVLPLCHRHHRTGGYGVAIHAGKKKWESIYGTEQELLDRVDELLNYQNNLMKG